MMTIVNSSRVEDTENCLTDTLFVARLSNDSCTPPRLGLESCRSFFAHFVHEFKCVTWRRELLHGVSTPRSRTRPDRFLNNPRVGHLASATAMYSVPPGRIKRSTSRSTRLQIPCILFGIVRSEFRPYNPRTKNVTSQTVSNSHLVSLLFPEK